MQWDFEVSSLRLLRFSTLPLQPSITHLTCLSNLLHLHSFKCTRLVLVPFLFIISPLSLQTMFSLILFLGSSFYFHLYHLIPSPPASTHLSTSLSLCFHLSLLLHIPWKQGAVVELLSAAAAWQPSLVAQPVSCPFGESPPWLGWISQYM